MLQSGGGWINQGGEEMMDRVGLESQSGGNINREMKMKTMIADIYISISMRTFEHRKYKSRSEDGNK